MCAAQTSIAAALGGLLALFVVSLLPACQHVAKGGCAFYCHGMCMRCCSRVYTCLCMSSGGQKSGLVVGRKAVPPLLPHTLHRILYALMATVQSFVLLRCAAASGTACLHVEALALRCIARSHSLPLFQREPA